MDRFLPLLPSFDFLTSYALLLGCGATLARVRAEQLRGFGSCTGGGLSAVAPPLAGGTERFLFSAL